MNEKQMKDIIADIYDESKENTLRGMIGAFYNRQNTAIVIMVWVVMLATVIPAVFCAIAFFRTDDVRMQMMYASIFIILMQWAGIIKVFAWLIIHRNGINREIKRLELRIAELNETVKVR